MQWVFLVYLCVASQTNNVWAQPTVFSLPLDTVNHSAPLVSFSSIERGPLVERSDFSYGGFVFDATGDGTADDVFVANTAQANEVLVLVPLSACPVDGYAKLDGKCCKFRRPRALAQFISLGFAPNIHCCTNVLRHLFV